MSFSNEEKEFIKNTTHAFRDIMRDAILNELTKLESADKDGATKACTTHMIGRAAVEAGVLLMIGVMKEAKEGEDLIEDILNDVHEEIEEVFERSMGYTVQLRAAGANNAEALEEVADIMSKMMRGGAESH